METKVCFSVSKALMAGAVLCASFLAGCEKNAETPAVATGAVTASMDAHGRSGIDYVPNEVLIKFKTGTAPTIKAAALANINGKVTEAILTRAMQSAGETEALLLVRTPLAAAEALARLSGNSIEYAEPNYLYTAQGSAAAAPVYVPNQAWPYYVANDHYFTTLDDATFVKVGEWGMYGPDQGASLTPYPYPFYNQYGTGADIAWANGNIGSAEVKVGIIDTGIQLLHPDLDGQIWNNPNASTVDSYPNDLHGWNFLDNNNDVNDYGFKTNAPNHGTHIAGIIGGIANNGTDGKLGVVGMNWNVTLIAGKFMGDRGGTTANAVRAIDYMTSLKSPTNNIVATNNSWGSTKKSDALYAAIQRANAADILFVAAAGSQSSPVNIDKTPFYPASYNLPNIISVAAINQVGDLSIDSNYGPLSVDLGAPGARIWTTTAGSSWSTYSSTSMATAFVTGAVALYASKNQTATAAEIKKAILDAAKLTPTSSLKGKTVTEGRLNVSKF